MPNLSKISSEVQKMAKNVKLQLKASYFRKVREKNNFYFGILAPQKHFQTNYTKIRLTLWKETPIHNVEFGPENGKSMPTFFEIQYLSQESIFCKNSKSGMQNMDIASLL